MRTLLIQLTGDALAGELSRHLAAKLGAALEPFALVLSRELTPREKGGYRVFEVRLRVVGDGGSASLVAERRIRVLCVGKVEGRHFETLTPPPQFAVIGGGLSGGSQIAFERKLKGSGARKVLFFFGDDEKRRAFDKIVSVLIGEVGFWAMSDEIPDGLVEKLKDESEDNKISCLRAREIAREFGVNPGMVGKALDMLGIKITDCELGCF